MAVSQGKNLLCSALRNFNYFNSKTFHFRRKIFTKFYKSIDMLPFEFDKINSRILYTSSFSLDKNRISLTFVKTDGSEITATGKEGDSILDVIQNNFEHVGFGACEGMVTCSTCHVIFKPEEFGKLSEKPSEEELDILDVTESTRTSRLGCQVFLNKRMDGLKVILPELTVADEEDEN